MLSRTKISSFNVIQNSKRSRRANLTLKMTTLLEMAAYVGEFFSAIASKPSYKTEEGIRKSKK